MNFRVDVLCFRFSLVGQKSIPELRHFYFKLHDRVFAHPQVDRGKELQAIISEELGDSSMTGDCVYMHQTKEPKYGGGLLCT